MHTFAPLSHRRLFAALSLLISMFLLTGCGGKKEDDKKKDDDKKPPYERVVILRERFDELERSLDEMERDLDLQRKRINKTRELAKSIRRSLAQGNLKGYSIDSITSDPVVAHALAERRAKQDDKKADRSEKKKAENKFLNGLLLVLFLIFIIVIFIVSFRDRNTPEPLSSSGPYYPPADENPESGALDTDRPDRDIPPYDHPEGTEGDEGPRT